MTMLDLMVAMVLLLTVVRGMMRGLVATLFSLGSWVLAFVAGKWGAALAGPLLPAALGDAGVRYFVGFGVIFLAVLIAVSLLSYAIVSIINAVGLGSIDKVLGGVMGLAKGGVILVGLTLAAGLTSLPHTDFWKQSASSDDLQALAKRALPLIPADVAKHVRFE
jgi:membrane protein required for colicin V production